MQQAQPLVSVIIPVYNSRKRLAACLDHVAAMDYPNLEVIIVDDCSTDGSLEICRTYEKKVPYFHVITKKNEGVSVTAAHAKGLKVWGLINDFDKNISLKRILGRTSTRSRLINNLVSTAMRYKLDGINIDFEKIKSDVAPAYLEFLRELTLVCHANDITVTVDDYLPTDATAYYDWKEQGKVADYVIFMAYDEHYAGSKESGSVSSLPFVENGVDKGLQYIPAERTVVALPFYTRLWKEVKSGDGVAVTSSAYGMSSAESVLQSNSATPKWDEETSQYYAEFKADGAKYKIWLEEETSLSKKMETVMAKNVAGIAFWKLGFERMATWTTIEKYVK